MTTALTYAESPIDSVYDELDYAYRHAEELRLELLGAQMELEAERSCKRALRDLSLVWMLIALLALGTAVFCSLPGRTSEPAPAVPAVQTVPVFVPVEIVPAEWFEDFGPEANLPAGILS